MQILKVQAGQCRLAQWRVETPAWATDSFCNSIYHSMLLIHDFSIVESCCYEMKGNTFCVDLCLASPAVRAAADALEIPSDRIPANAADLSSGFSSAEKELSHARGVRLEEPL